VLAGALLNGLVFVLAYLITQHTKRVYGEGYSFAIAPEDAKQNNAAKPMLGNFADWHKTGAWILPVIAISGVVTFSYEVLWTRLLSHVLGGTVFAFATMLASFLTGIALGGAIAGKFCKNRQQASFVFTICQVGIALTSLAAYVWITSYRPIEAGLKENVLLAFFVMTPSTLFIGATFPLAVRILTHDALQASHSTAKVYAWNTVGAIIGSVLAGFFLIPELGFSGDLRLNIWLNGLLAAAACYFLAQKYRAILITAGISLLALFYNPGIPYSFIDTSLVDNERGGDIEYYAVGRAATVLLKKRDGSYYLRTNGLPEATIEPKGEPPALHDQKWLTALPAIARPDAQNMLIVGLGGGVAIEGAPPNLKQIDVIEIESQVTRANQQISAERRFDPLSDPRVRIVHNDARNAMSLTQQKYDIVVSQPSHPWTAGASHLYTAEFVQLARQVMTPDGVFVQWINAGFVDEKLLRSIAVTLKRQFKYVRLYQPSPSVLHFLASQSALEIETELVKTGRPLNDHPEHFSGLGIFAVEDLIAALVATNDGLNRLALGGVPNTDDDNRMAFASRPRGDGLTTKSLYQLFAPLDPLIKGALGETLQTINYDYLTRKVIAIGNNNRAIDLAKHMDGTAEGYLVQGIGLRYQGRRDYALGAFTRSLQQDPQNQQAAYAIVREFLPALATGKAPAEVQKLAESMTGVPAAVIKGWKLGMQQDWIELAKLDTEFGGVQPTDIWFPEVAKLKAEWRTKVDAGDQTKALNMDAVESLDAALMISRQLDLLVLRATAAARMQDVKMFTETTSHIARQLEENLARYEAGTLNLNQRALDLMSRRVAGFKRLLASDFAQTDKVRADEVKDHFLRLEEQISQIKKS